MRQAMPLSHCLSISISFSLPCAVCVVASLSHSLPLYLTVSGCLSISLAASLSHSVWLQAISLWRYAISTTAEQAAVTSVAIQFSDWQSRMIAFKLWIAIYKNQHKASMAADVSLAWQQLQQVVSHCVCLLQHRPVSFTACLLYCMTPLLHDSFAAPLLSVGCLCLAMCCFCGFLTDIQSRKLSD